MKHLIKNVLNWAEQKLLTNKIRLATLDAEVLLAFVLNQDRAWLYAHNDQKLTVGQWKKFQKLIARRQHHEPVAYLTGHQAFYGLDFLVNKQVLIPRPETELMIDFLKEQTVLTDQTVLDVGTGSGCLAVTVAKLWPKTKILAIDISPAALKVAQANARRHHVTKQIKFIKGNLLKPLLSKSDFDRLFVLANLPYLSTKQWRQTLPEVRRFEPKTALDGGPDGLKYYRALIKQLTDRPSSLTVLLEIDPDQATALDRVIKKQLPRAAIEIKKDLAGLKRLVVIKTSKFV